MFKISKQRKSLVWRLQLYNFFKLILNISFSFPTQISSLQSCNIAIPVFKETSVFGISERLRFGNGYGRFKIIDD